MTEQETERIDELNSESTALYRVAEKVLNRVDQEIGSSAILSGYTPRVKELYEKLRLILDGRIAKENKRITEIVDKEIGSDRYNEYCELMCERKACAKYLEAMQEQYNFQLSQVVPFAGLLEIATKSVTALAEAVTAEIERIDGEIEKL